MRLEHLVSDMMKMNSMSRLWHWTTDSAQHHTTYEQFLTQNEQFTDSLVESALGNDIELDFSKVGIDKAFVQNYDLAMTKESIGSYRGRLFQMQKNIEEFNNSAGAELISILDDAIELCSKTLYLLKLK